MPKYVSSNNDYTYECKFPKSFLNHARLVFSIIYRNETNIGTTYLDFDLDIIWLKEWFVAVDDSHA